MRSRRRSIVKSRGLYRRLCAAVTGVSIRVLAMWTTQHTRTHAHLAHMLPTIYIRLRRTV